MVASLVLMASLLASLTPDPSGWRELRWGTTVPEAEATFTRMNGGRPVQLVRIPSGERRDELYDVVGFADEGNVGPMKLGKRTATFHEGGLVKLTFNFDSPHVAHTDEHARAFLTRMYGPPKRETKATGGIVGNVEESEWLVGSTLITLRATPALGPVCLEYAERAPTNKDLEQKLISIAP